MTNQPPLFKPKTRHPKRKNSATAGPQVRRDLEVEITTLRRGIDDYLRRLGSPAQPGVLPTSPIKKLTPRQREVLQLIAEGRTTQEIAERLQVGVKTVEKHRAQLMDRLDIHDVAGLVWC